MSLEADIEGTFKVTARSKSGDQRVVRSGYRPQHQIKPGYQTSGQHEYPFANEVKTGESAVVRIKFITPEFYPHALREGQVIEVFEGQNPIGAVEVSKIFNLILKIRMNPDDPRFLFKIDEIFNLTDSIVLLPGFTPTDEPIKPGQTITLIDLSGNKTTTKIKGLTLASSMNRFEQVQIIIERSTLNRCLILKSNVWLNIPSY